VRQVGIVCGWAECVEWAKETTEFGGGRIDQIISFDRVKIEADAHVICQDRN
jgi:hypothetical protein